MVEAAEIEFGLALFTKPLKTQDVQQNQCFFAFSSRCNKKQQIPFRMIEKDGINSPQPPQFRLTTPLGFTRPVSKILAPVRKRVETAVPALRRWALVLARTPKWKLPTVVGPASCRSFSARCQKKLPCGRSLNSTGSLPVQFRFWPGASFFSSLYGDETRCARRHTTGKMPVPLPAAFDFRVHRMDKFKSGMERGWFNVTSLGALFYQSVKHRPGVGGGRQRQLPPQVANILRRRRGDIQPVAQRQVRA